MSCCLKKIGTVKSFFGVTTLVAILGMASTVQAEGNRETLTLQFVGQATGAAWDGLTAGSVSTIQALADGNSGFDVASLDGFACFEVDLVNPSNGVVIGVGVDCLSPDDKGDGVVVKAF